MKKLFFALSLFVLTMFTVPAAHADDHHGHGRGGRGHGNGGYRHQGHGGYRNHGYPGGRRGHYRYRHGRRYYDDDNGYYGPAIVRPPIDINIGL